nr:AlNc14C73G4976 [Albugo laibachii Nc14]|eukprot:CCA19551.1 AlNc14C73G4976 [Albugo laibachii Nc14]
MLNWYDPALVEAFVLVMLLLTLPTILAAAVSSKICYVRERRIVTTSLDKGTFIYFLDILNRLPLSFMHLFTRPRQCVYISALCLRLTHSRHPNQPIRSNIASTIRDAASPSHPNERHHLITIS